MGIEWRDVVGFENIFMVSNRGDIYSKRTNKGLTVYTQKSGYRVLSTRVGGRKGKCYLLKVHRMVAEAFILNLHNKPMVNHIDGDKSNNHIRNLEWVTCKENAIHAHRMGLTKPPSQKHVQKLSVEDINFILKSYKPRDRNFGTRALGRRFNVHKNRITYIIKNGGYKT